VIAYSGVHRMERESDSCSRDRSLRARSVFLRQKDQVHLDYRTSLDERERLGWRRLVLAHMSEDMLLRVGDLEIEYAEDGWIIELYCKDT
jgi:hypothetical protein